MVLKQDSPPASLASGTHHALLIAVEEYGDPNVTDLDQPVADAKRLAEVLTRHYTFDLANLTTLVNPDRRGLYHAVGDLRTRVKPGDSVLIFFAGHGVWQEGIEQGYWLPADAEKDNEADWVSNSDIRDRIRGIKSQHTLLVSDACFGGSLFKTRKAFAGPSRAVEELHRLPSRKAMTSGTLSEVPDRSVFLRYLVDRLTGNAEPFIAANRLFASFREAVINNAPHAPNTPQYGVIQGAGDEGGEFVFVRRDALVTAASTPDAELVRRADRLGWSLPTAMDFQSQDESEAPQATRERALPLPLDEFVKTRDGHDKIRLRSRYTPGLRGVKLCLKLEGKVWWKRVEIGSPERKLDNTERREGIEGEGPGLKGCVVVKPRAVTLYFRKAKLLGRKAGSVNEIYMDLTQWNEHTLTFSWISD